MVCITIVRAVLVSADISFTVELWYTVTLVCYPTLFPFREEYLTFRVRQIMDSNEWDLAPKKGKEYKLAVDTGEPFFVFAETFRRAEPLLGDCNLCVV